MVSLNTFQLECFLAVAENLSFARAAQQLHITQPAVTQQIKALEKELNAKLFARSTRSVKLTREGAVFLYDSQHILAIARRMGYGMKIFIGDKRMENARTISRIMNEAGFDTEALEMDLSSRESIRNLIAEAQKAGPITMLVNAAGVSPSQAPIEAILKVDLYGTAVLLEEVGKVIAPSGVGAELSEYVSQAVAVIRDSGLPNETNAMFTNIEGDLDDVLRVVRDATMKLAEQGYRTGVTLKLDIRPGFSGQLTEKSKLVDELRSK